jgi:hypothetical protein
MTKKKKSERIARVVVCAKGRDGIASIVSSKPMRLDDLRALVEMRNVIQIQVMVAEEVTRRVGEYEIVSVGASMVAVMRGSEVIGKADVTMNFLTGVARYKIMNSGRQQNGKFSSGKPITFSSASEMVRWMDARRSERKRKQ